MEAPARALPRAWAAVTLLLCLAGVEGGWPAGMYAIPMSKTGCPEVTDFTWEVGTRTHQTEMGSHASESSHLAGIYTYETDRVTQSFCVKSTPVSDGMYTWQKGRYCIMKVKMCPKGFREGWLYWDDAAPWFAETVQNQSGTLPDGVYDRNTKIMFCCRNDGSAAEPVPLPTNSPFHLLRWGDRCQEVRGMTASEEYVYWEDEKAMNMNTQGGLYPSVLRSKYPKKYTKVYYCYYTKAPASRNLKTLFTILYVIAGVAGAIIFLLVLLCIIQRIANRKNKQFYDDHNVSNAARERMIRHRGDVERPQEPQVTATAPQQHQPSPAHRTPLPEPVVEYRPPEYTPTPGIAGDPGDGSVSFRDKKNLLYPYVDPSRASAASIAAGMPTAGTSGGGVPVLESPTNDGPGSLSSAEEHTPMLQLPAFDPARATSPQPGAALDMRRPLSQPPSYEEVLREDGRLPPS